jgi:hypothetical protein
MIRKMEEECINGQMEIFTTDNFQMIWDMETVIWFGMTEVLMKVNGLEDCQMGKVNYYLIKVCIKQKVKNQNTVYLKIMYWFSNWNLFLNKNHVILINLIVMVNIIIQQYKNQNYI